MEANIRSGIGRITKRTDLNVLSKKEPPELRAGSRIKLITERGRGCRHSNMTQMFLTKENGRIDRKAMAVTIPGLLRAASRWG